MHTPFHAAAQPTVSCIPNAGNNRHRGLKTCQKLGSLLDGSGKLFRCFGGDMSLLPSGCCCSAHSSLFRRLHSFARQRRISAANVILWNPPHLLSFAAIPNELQLWLEFTVTTWIFATVVSQARCCRSRWPLALAA